VLFLVGTSNYVDRSIIGVLLEPIKAEFQVSDTMLGLLSGISFALMYATFGIPIARWADRGDRRLVITLSMVVWNIMTGLCGVASGFWQLAAARFGVGLGESGAIPPAQSLLADYYPPEDRARAFGVFGTSSSAGYAIALILGGFLAQNFGWRAAFLAFGLLGMGLAPLTYLVLREPRHASQFAVRSGDYESTRAAVRVLFAKATYRNILVSIVLYFLVAYGALVFIVSVMIRVHGLSVAKAGATFGTIVAVSALIGNLVGGAVADRLARRNLAWLAPFAGWGMIAAMPIFQLALWSPSLVTMIPLLLLAMVLLSGVVPAMYSALHVVCGSKRRALAVAIAFFFANLIGLGLGPVIAGSLSDVLAFNYGPAEGLRYALMIVTNVLALAGWFMLRAVRYLQTDAED
jgi:predicted MFS family arabinose efflux permease